MRFNVNINSFFLKIETRIILFYRRASDTDEDNTTIEDMEKEKAEASEKNANHYTKSQAWKNSDKAIVESDTEVAYNYKDISIMMDRVNFVIF